MNHTRNKFLPLPQAIIDIQSDTVKALIDMNKSLGQGSMKSHPLIKDLAFRMIDMGYKKQVIAACIGVSYSTVVKWNHKRELRRRDQPMLFDPAPVLVEAGTITVMRRKKSLLQRVMDWFR